MSDRLAQLLKLHQSDPRDPFLTYGIALEHGKRGDLDEAITWLDRTLASDPRYCYAYFQKAKMLGELGRCADACRAAELGLAAAGEAGDAKAAGELSELLTALREEEGT